MLGTGPLPKPTCSSFGVESQRVEVLGLHYNSLGTSVESIFKRETACRAKTSFDRSQGLRIVMRLTDIFPFLTYLGTSLPGGMWPWCLLEAAGIFEGSASYSLLVSSSWEPFGRQTRPSGLKAAALWALRRAWRTWVARTFPRGLNKQREGNGHNLLPGKFPAKLPKGAQATCVQVNLFPAFSIKSAASPSGRGANEHGAETQNYILWQEVNLHFVNQSPLLPSVFICLLVCSWACLGSNERRGWRSLFCLWGRGTFSNPVFSVGKLTLCLTPIFLLSHLKVESNVINMLNSSDFSRYQLDSFPVAHESKSTE